MATKKAGGSSRNGRDSAGRRLGVKNADGGALPKRNLTSRLVVPSRGNGKAYIAYANYDNILKWNRSNFFAIAVGTLADMIQHAE